MNNNLNDKLAKLKEISEINKVKVSEVSNQIAAIEESLDTLCLYNDVEIIVDFNLMLSYEKSNQKRLKRRIFVTPNCNGENPQKKPMCELPITLRLQAFDKLDLLLEEIYKEQISIVNLEK